MVNGFDGNDGLGGNNELGSIELDSNTSSGEFTEYLGDTFLGDTTGSDNLTSDKLTSASGEDNSVITARGTGDGLVLRLDGCIQLHALKAALLSYVETRQGFLVGQEVIFEWLGSRPEEGVVAELTQILSSRFGVLVKASRMAERSQFKNEQGFKQEQGKSDQVNKSPQSFVSSIKPTDASIKGLASKIDGEVLATRSEATEDSSSQNISSTGFKPKLTPVDGERFDRVSRVSPGSSTSGHLSLFDGLSGGNTARSNDSKFNDTKFTASSTAAATGVINESLLWDDPDARIIRQTLRSGQKIESEFSVIIYGDVNSGAEVVAGGDIVILGKLRGVAHAGAFEESGRGRFIFAIQMQPTQLRIGSVMSRGRNEDSLVPEVARVDGTMINVEPFIKTTTSPTKKRW